MKTYLFILTFCLVLTSAQRFSSISYQVQSSQEKIDQLWKEITADQTSANWFSPWQFAKIFLESMKPSFDVYSDVLPQGRKKYVHAVGAVAQAELISEKGNPYTGMFQGVSNVLIRLSTGLEPNPKKPAINNFVPGMGIKLLRDKIPSANLIAMYTVDGQDSFNFFKYDLSNHVPDAQTFALKALGRKFSQATPYDKTVGLKTWSQYDEKGQKVEDSNLKFPFKLLFRPTAEVHTKFPDTYSDTLTNQLKTIPAGIVLYDILAVENPHAEPVKIASLKLKSGFVTSKFGDQSVFFQHNYMEDDVKVCPQWDKDIPKAKSFVGKIKEYLHS